MIYLCVGRGQLVEFVTQLLRDVGGGGAGVGRVENTNVGWPRFRLCRPLLGLYNKKINRPHTHRHRQRITVNGC